MNGFNKNFDVIQRRVWTEEELQEAGFQYYERRKQVVMARELPPEEAPKTIKTSWDTLVAEAGSMICYEPSYMPQPTLDDYNHWPVDRQLFEDTYARWDEPDRTPTPAEMDLLLKGCEPYYKFAGVWAKSLERDTFVLSLESTNSARIPAGAWLCIGVDGEPWSQTEDEFRARYVIDPEREWQR